MGTVAGIWRYPVKSVHAVRVEAGDRAWACFGVYADVLHPADLRTGDKVRVG